MATQLLWTTVDEILFIKQLGTGVFLDRRIRTAPPSLDDRLKVLNQYRASLNSRRIWAGMNCTEIKMAVDAQIRYVQTLIRNKE